MSDINETESISPSRRILIVRPIPNTKKKVENFTETKADCVHFTENFFFFR